MVNLINSINVSQIKTLLLLRHVERNLKKWRIVYYSKTFVLFFLIVKKGEINILQNYRSIILMNTDHKIIAFIFV